VLCFGSSGFSFHVALLVQSFQAIFETQYWVTVRFGKGTEKLEGGVLGYLLHAHIPMCPSKKARGSY
jgi:hypothetical protein